MGFFEEVSNSIKHWLRIKDDKQALLETEQDLLKKMNQLSNKGKSLSFDYAMNVFKEVVENPILENLLDKYPDLMESNNYCFTHSSKVKFIFKYTVELISTEEVMIMANYLASNRIMHKLQIEDMSANAIIASLTAMAEKCPLDNKLKLYSMLDSSGAITAGYKTGYPSMNASYIISAFKGVETEKALTVLKYSDSWLNLKKNGDLVDRITNHDERLLSAIH